MDEPNTSEQTAETESNASSGSGQFMDIQTPKSSDTAPPLPGPAAMGGSVPNFNESLSSEETTATVQSAPAAVATPAPDATVASSSDVPEQPADPDHNPLAIPPQAAHKSGAPVVAVVVAIIVALALAGLVIFTFMKSKNASSTSKKAPTTAATQTTAKPLASPADVDATNKDIDTSLSKTDDTKDFPAADLSDKSLGL